MSFRQHSVVYTFLYGKVALYTVTLKYKNNVFD